MTSALKFIVAISILACVCNCFVAREQQRRMSRPATPVSDILTAGSDGECTPCSDPCHAFKCCDANYTICSHLQGFCTCSDRPKFG
ncbi:unnamed protein product [Orchesella dallaii]|uniref:Uncharacterized protein n=1 Tax=Orchesella dallaii TaxID=48710 RepID=A0ABP1PN55_9HEXA